MMRCAMPSISAAACSRVTPGLRRANTLNGRTSRVICASVAMKGTHSSLPSGNFMPSGMTPTMVAALPLIRRMRPTTFGSRPNRFVHKS